MNFPRSKNSDVVSSENYIKDFNITKNIIFTYSDRYFIYYHANIKQKIICCIYSIIRKIIAGKYGALR
jgi:hypothetical protein